MSRDEEDEVIKRYENDLRPNDFCLQSCSVIVL